MAETDTPLAKQKYEQRLAAWHTVLDAENKRYRMVSDIRLWTVIAGLVAAWWSWPYAFGPAAVFIALVVWHVRIDERRTAAARGISYFERGLKRLDGRWAGTGSSGEKFVDPNHVYADDLDVFGKGSLFELLSTARTSAGESKLAGWLLHPSLSGEVDARQQAVRELTSQVELRETAALTGEDIHANWRLQPMLGFPRWASPVCWTVTAAALTAVAFWNTTAILSVALIALGLLFVFRHQVIRGMEALESSARELDLLVRLLRHLEDRQFQCPLLQKLRSAVTGSSKEVAYLKRLVTLADTGRNQYLIPVTIPLLWNVHVAHAIWRWQETHRENVDQWMQALAEFEALCSLSCYAYENPANSFPELASEPEFRARDLGHPLLTADRCVCNDAAFGGSGDAAIGGSGDAAIGGSNDCAARLLIVSGSNMSGKSTLLRAVGLNVILAWAGAPVRASYLRTGRFAVGASLRTADSIQDGKSRFYAEITRLKQITDLTSGERPVLFLLDELLSGTNSHDRRIGAQGILEGLIRRGAVGLVTTHDLALAAIAETSNREIQNVHFEDQVVDDEIHFDYKMRPGVVTRSNALELMRLVGLLR